jgi:hypothetical protein
MFRQELHTVKDSNLRSQVLPCLRGRVFHVTTAEALPSILTLGEIRWDFGTARYANAYFRSQGSVSVCDLRSVSETQLQDGLDKYFFLNPFHRDHDPAFLFLSEEAHPSLKSWREQLERGDLNKLVVPYIEAGYPGHLPVTLLDSALVLKIVHAPLSPQLEALMKVNTRQAHDG